MHVRRKMMRFEPLEVRRLLASVRAADFPSMDEASNSSFRITVRYDADVLGADSSSNYLLRNAGADGVLTDSDLPRSPDRVALDGRNADLYFSGEFSRDLYRLTVRDAVTDLSGKGIDGDQDGIPGGDWVSSHLLSEQSQFGFDTTFGESGTVRWDLEGWEVGRITEQQDGKYFVEGMVQKNSTNHALLARFNRNGTLDTTFNRTGYVIEDVGRYGYTAAVQVTDGYVVKVTSQEFRESFRLLKFRTDGSRDLSFGSHGIAKVEVNMKVLGPLKVAPDGKLLAVGSTYVPSQRSDSITVLRLNPNGSIDESFGTGGVFTKPTLSSVWEWGRLLAIQSDAKVLVIGDRQASDPPYNPLASVAFRLHPNGELDTSFGQAGEVLIAPENLSLMIAFTNQAIAVRSDNSFVVASRQTYSPDQSMRYSGISLSSFLANGKPDLQFGTNGQAVFDIGSISDDVLSMNFDNNGQIMLAASGGRGVAQSNLYLLKLNANGTRDVTFGLGGAFEVVPQHVDSTIDPAHFRQEMSGAFTSDGKYIMGGLLMYSSPAEPSWKADMLLARFDTGNSLLRLANDLGDTFTLSPNDWGTGQLQEISGLSIGSLNRLTVDGSLVDVESIGVLTNDGQTFVTDSVNIAGLQIQRELTVPKSGTSSYLQTVETLSNRSSAAIQTNVQVNSTFLRDPRMRVFATSDGDDLVEPTDRWIGFDDADPTGGAQPIIQVFRSDFVGTPTQIYATGDDHGWEYALRVQPGESARIVTFTVTGSSRQQAIENAQSLFTYSRDNTALQFLTDDEIRSIVNFKFNYAPTDIKLSSRTILEDAPLGTRIGVLSTVDRNLPDGDRFVYTLVSGDGSRDNASFQIVGDQLLLNTTLEYASKPSYSIRVRTADRAGSQFEKVFVVEVINIVGAPTDIHLSHSEVQSNSVVGTLVGELSAAGVKAEDVVRYALVPGEGDQGNSHFQITGNALQTASSPLTRSVYPIRVRATVARGDWIEKVFRIVVHHENRPPIDITLSNNYIEGVVIKRSFIGEFNTVDPDENDSFRYELVGGVGAEDNAKFVIQGNALWIAQPLEYTESVFHIRVRSTDLAGHSIEKTFDIYFMPLVIDDAFGTTTGQPIRFDILANDWNDAGFSVRITQPMRSSSGEFELIDNHQIRFTPSPGFTGIGVLSYHLVNSSGTQSNLGTVRVAVAKSEFQNPWNSADVDNSGYVSPIDALLVINQLNYPTSQSATGEEGTARRYFDVNGDVVISPIDALLVINALLKNQSQGEGEASSAFNAAWVFDIDPYLKLRRKAD